jgi:NADH-quinone oxidoreductase subunit D
MSRIISHLVWLGTTCIDIGAYTPFLWAFQQREKIYELFEAWIGARLTTTFTRVGGMGADIPDGWLEGLTAFTHNFPKVVDEIDRIITRNGIWVGRTVGLGVMSPEEGGELRALRPDGARIGVAFDVRRDFPYLDYETYDFDVPVGTNGDVYDRFSSAWKSFASRREFSSRRSSAARRPVNVERPPRRPAAKEQGDERHGIDDPSLQAGDGRTASADRRVLRRGRESQGRERLLHGVDGSPKPVRWRIRPPSFVNLSAIPRMVEGTCLSDVIAINASIDIVMGEIDRCDRRALRPPDRTEDRGLDTSARDQRESGDLHSPASIARRLAHHHEPYKPVFTTAAHVERSWTRSSRATRRKWRRSSQHSGSCSTSAAG